MRQYALGRKRDGVEKGERRKKGENEVEGERDKEEGERARGVGRMEKVGAVGGHGSAPAPAKRMGGWIDELFLPARALWKAPPLTHTLRSVLALPSVGVLCARPRTCVCVCVGVCVCV